MNPHCMPPEYGDSAAAYPAAQERPALIVFDLDGTISDSFMVVRESYKRVFKMLGYDLSDEQADAFNGPSADEICRVMGVGPDRRPLYDELMDTVAIDLIRTIGHMFPGTERMFEALAPHAILAILTNGSVKYCQACIETFCLSPYISLSSGFVSGVSKAQRIAQWERELNARRVICVGDRGTDVANARAAGALAVGVTYGAGDREELSGADALCDTPQELADTLLRLIAQD